MKKLFLIFISFVFFSGSFSYCDAICYNEPACCEMQRKEERIILSTWVVTESLKFAAVCLCFLVPIATGLEIFRDVKDLFFFNEDTVKNNFFILQTKDQRNKNN